MNKALSIIFVLSHLFTLNAQNDNDLRFITVTGSASIVVAPDQIELEIIIREYENANEVKIELDSIDRSLRKVLRNNGIDDEVLNFNNVSYSWYYWWRYRNDRFRQKSYRLKLNSSTDFMTLVKDLNFNGIYSMRISNSTNRELQKLRKELKVSAVIAAKEKAKYLLESIDEELGPVISIVEVADNRHRYWMNSQNMITNVSLNRGSHENDMSNVANIKLKYEVKAKFEIASKKDNGNR